MITTSCFSIFRFKEKFTYKACKDAAKPIKSVVGTRRSKFPSKRKFCKLWR